MTRIGFYRWVECPALGVFVVSDLAWLACVAWGHTLGEMELSGYAGLLGSLVGLFLGMLVAMRYADVLPGLVPARWRQVRCCIAAFFIGGVLAAAAALAFNRLGPSGPEAQERYVVEAAVRTKGGWDVDIRNGQGRVYTVRFKCRPDPSHPHLELTVRAGALGYPYFTAIRTAAPGD